MGRPVEVHDEEIIAAGLRLESRGIEVKATRLWTELGERGLPRRMFVVWTKFAAERVTPPDPTVGGRPLLPERAKRLADGLKTQLGDDLDRIVAAIHDDIQATVASRFRDEFASMEAARIAHVSEVDEALDALGRLGEECHTLRATLRQVEQDAAVTLRECDIKDDLLVKVALEQAASTELVATIRERVETEKSNNVDLRLDVMRAQTLVESSGNSLAILQGELVQQRLDTRRLEATVAEHTVSAQALQFELAQCQSLVTEASAERDRARARCELLDLRARKAEQALEALRSTKAATRKRPAHELSVIKRTRPSPGAARQSVHGGYEDVPPVAPIVALRDERRPGGPS